MPNLVNGSALDSKRFVGVTTLGELISAGLLRPSLSLRDAKESAFHGEEAINLRTRVQRRFDAVRKDRAKAYSRYIMGLSSGVIKGGVPPINIFVSGSVNVSGNSLILPARSVMAVIDGETQTEARFILLEDEGVEASSSWPIAVMIWHDCEVDEAKQFLVDVNQYCSPIGSKLNLAMDTEGRLTQTVKKALALAGIDQRSVNSSSDLPGKRKRITLRQVQAAAAGVALNGYTYGRSYADTLSELNHPFPANPAFNFDVESVASVVADILRAAESRDAIHSSGPLVFLAAGIRVKQGASPDSLDYARASNVKFKKAGSVSKKLDLLKSAL